MTADMIPFDYAGLPSEHAGEVRAAAERIKIRMKRTAEDIIEIGRDLITVKERLPHGQFGMWIDVEFGMSDSTAQNFMNVAGRFGSKFPTVGNLTSRVLYALAAPSTDDAVIERAVAKAEAGEEVTVAEVARLKAEHKAKEERLVREAAAVRHDLEALQQKSAEKAAKASRREANLIEDKNRALADKAAAEARTAEEVKRAQEATWAEADEKYETLVRRLNREAAEARRLAEEKTKALDVAVAQARAEAEQAAKDLAEALAAKALETRKSELDKLDAAAAKAEARVATAARTEAVLQGEIRKHEAYLAKCRGEEAEALEQIKLARDLSEFLGQKMAELTLFEYDVQPVARPKILRAAQMCGQMAQALDAFLAPRLAA